MKFLLSLIPLAIVAASNDGVVSRDLYGYGHDECPYYCIYRAKALYYCVHQHDSCKDHIKDICDHKDDDDKNDDDEDDDHKDYKDGKFSCSISTFYCFMHFWSNCSTLSYYVQATKMDTEMVGVELNFYVSFINPENSFRLSHHVYSGYDAKDCKDKDYHGYGHAYDAASDGEKDSSNTVNLSDPADPKSDPVDAGIADTTHV